MRTRFILIAATAAAVAAGVATAAGESRITVALKMQNHSGRSGVATLTQANGQITITVAMHGKSRFPGATESAHIHNVTCAQYARMTNTSQQIGTVETQLNAVVANKSKTSAYSTLAAVADGKHSINVHEMNSPYRVVACGNIPKR